MFDVQTCVPKIFIIDPNVAVDFDSDLINVIFSREVYIFHQHVFDQCVCVQINSIDPGNGYFVVDQVVCPCGPSLSDVADIEAVPVTVPTFILIFRNLLEIVKNKANGFSNGLVEVAMGPAYFVLCLGVRRSCVYWSSQCITCEVMS